MAILPYGDNGLPEHLSAVLAIILRPGLSCEGRSGEGATATYIDRTRPSLQSKTWRFAWTKGW